MTSLDDRVTRLENAFVELVPLVRELVEGQNRMEATQARMLETLQVHTNLLQSVVSTLQGHSTDLTLIKGYLNTRD